MLMKKKAVFKYIVSMAAVVLAVLTWVGTKQVAGAAQRLEKIEAEYLGDAVEVGKEINLKDIYVSADYYIYDGYSGYTEEEEVKKDYTIEPKVVEKKGDNKVIVTYRGKTDIITVEGKTVESISAEYTGEDDLYIGTTIPVGKIEVHAFYSDGSTEKVKGFTLATTTVEREGLNTVRVAYGGKTEVVYIFGKAPLAIEEIIAFYTGDPVIEGNSINKADIVVEALYNDGTMKEVKNFNISPSVVEQEGENEITVSYGNVSTVIEVYGEERYITDMRARYTGPGVIIGKNVKKEEIEVIVTYNDGSEEEIDTYEIYGEEILYEGENVVLIYCDAFMADIVVQGVKGFAANYDNSISNYFVSADGYSYTEVTLSMNMEVGADKFMLLRPDEEMVQRMVQRVVTTDKFIGFELFYDDDEMVLEFPMAMKVTLPDDFDPEKFAVYYTPNQATIMAKVDGEFLSEEQKEYEFIVYQPGVYILVNEESDRLVTDIIVETELELRVNRNYSLNPVVFPENAENTEVSFYSTDEDVATVSENGKIRTHSEGTCEIWIEAMDDSGVLVIVTVEVKGGR